MEEDGFTVVLSYMQVLIVGLTLASDGGLLDAD